MEGRLRLRLRQPARPHQLLFFPRLLQRQGRLEGGEGGHRGQQGGRAGVGGRPGQVEGVREAVVRISLENTEPVKTWSVGVNSRLRI